MNALTNHPPTRRPSPIARALLALLTAFGLVAGTAVLPASATPPSAYVGLGDSIAAGTGGSDYVDATCLRTAEAYPTQLGGLNNACFGATTSIVVQTQLGALNGAVRRVSVTVGANDIGSGQVAAACMSAPQSTTCQQALAKSLFVDLPQLPGKIRTMITAIRAKAPNAAIVLTGYPRLFTVSPTEPVIQRTMEDTINYATDLLNTTIATSAYANGTSFSSVTWAFIGHGIGSAAPWIHSPRDTTNQLEWFHPNDSGYTLGYVPAVRPYVQ
ncbi:SGNH/GDSL hydrolase family protein [Sinomonas sp. ASV486]|uniref:SGNH/GDSL hydrolase family protein n=1 Tax=Sinomonas sp. ASV486 TaxID=3051170 RepID=UPI0027DC244B|nr:SGNH/GDSL hydrolase family protein [Sinomonas sp. ASV486]MDQ4492011.1 SGNH/GDSL hydrolase family protein [Sinomonas sp. ASV486]